MLFVFILLLAVVPNPVCGGGFTADKRVYVTNEQWATEPYRYLLAKYVEEDGIEKNRCTANMVCGKIVTARHCIHDDCHNSNEIHMFKAYDGTKLQAKCENMGDYVLDQIGAKEGKNGDWAILEPIDEHKQFVVDNGICNFPSHTEGSSGRVYAAGFGGLKIMSDAEIESLRRAYVYFLENHIEYESGLKRVATISAAENEDEGLYLEDGKNSTAFNNLEKYIGDSDMSCGLVVYEMLRLYCECFNNPKLLENLMLFQWVGVTLLTDVVNTLNRRNQWYLDKTVFGMNMECHYCT